MIAFSRAGVTRAILTRSAYIALLEAFDLGLQNAAVPRPTCDVLLQERAKFWRFFRKAPRPAGKESRRGLDAALFGAFDEPQTMVAGVFHLTHQIEIAGGPNHDAAILPVLHRPALPPSQAAISLSLFSLKHFNFARG